MLGLLTLRARMTRTNFLLLGMLANFVVVAVDSWLALRMGWNRQIELHQIIGIPPAQAAWVLATAAFWLMLFVARLHDVGRSGWWALAMPLLVVAGNLLPNAAAIACGAALIAGWLVLLFWPGTIGPNRYSADPRGWESREHFERQQRELAEDSARSRSANPRRDLGA